MTKVSSIHDQRRKREWQALAHQADPEGLFNIQMDDVCQYLDSANISKSDPVTLHGASLVAVKRLLMRFGIEATPATYGELMGALHYCLALHGFINRVEMSAENAALWQEVREKGVRERLPELYPSYLAYRTGDIEALRTIARTTLTLPVMAQYYRLEEGAWVSNWRELWPPRATE